MKFLKYAVVFLFGIGSVLSSAQETPMVVASASIFADMARQLGGELIEVKSIVPIGGDPHTYSPTPGDATLVVKADLLLVNGLTFEGWINELIENAGTKAEVITVTKDIDVIESAIYQNATDPHAWMNAENGLVYAKNIFNALVKLLPLEVSYLTQRYEDYRKEIAELHQYIQQQINTIPESQRYLITSHDAFHYYGKEYGIQTEAILGTSTDADAQTSDIIRLNKLIQENNIPSVFIETTVNPKLLKRIATDNKIKIGGKLYSDSIGGPDSPASTYLDMLRYNTDVIVAALTSSPNMEIDPTEQSGGSSYAWIIVLGVAFVAAFLLLLKFIR